ncbi:hypothetical protein QBC33DRAFT_549218 [Phialemonium atrogriseum]|uniref:Uncharacterized protein n=1 Tax=Phialemonium atrogriseum TaxID=1093897 RepID=A0AAJ0BUY9_9PEZI|nr:uncharacterized protein QBC33DRAFT_549218 [Phialemonium atrogriseum]KAK1763522.1 hypothetical protein QBC33DRAFT_549218 [Phialemonium atrogriseum]
MGRMAWESGFLLADMANLARGGAVRYSRVIGSFVFFFLSPPLFPFPSCSSFLFYLGWSVCVLCWGVYARLMYVLWIGWKVLLLVRQKPPAPIASYGSNLLELGNLALSLCVHRRSFVPSLAPVGGRFVIGRA